MNYLACVWFLLFEKKTQTMKAKKWMSLIKLSLYNKTLYCRDMPLSIAAFCSACMKYTPFEYLIIFFVILFKNNEGRG